MSIWPHLHCRTDSASTLHLCGTPSSSPLVRQYSTLWCSYTGKSSGEERKTSGKGGTWRDSPSKPNGGNCYNCHQISKEEISYGTLGPSLYQYGKLRGNSEAVVKYTWGKIYNAKAYNACTNMPRFGHSGILTEAQMKDLMALLLDPNSPVNKN